MTEALEGYEHYREFMDKLTESNVDEYVDLPMIAVMGDTSSGKSSLLSNISLVELPSSENLTTRCPIKLQMHHAPTRSASVKVLWKDIPKGVTDIHFPEKHVNEENWHDLTRIIAEAQAHIVKHSGKEVARDIVSVDMKGPHCENLTLIDLPGIVRSTGKGESATLAEDIQSLMNDYLKNSRCVILAVLPCNVDFHNSQIMAEARKVDPETKRTIPVLTKPDLIDAGAETSVKELLLGLKTDSFDMGFHMVRGRGQDALNKKETIEEGLKKEEAFFRNKEPWRSIDDKSLFGTKNLRVKLATLQMDLIRSSFRSIITEMKDQRDNAGSELKVLGDIPTTLLEKRSLFRGVREDIWKNIGAETLDGKMCYLHGHEEDVRPSAEFHRASKEFQDKLNSSKLANISDIIIGTKVIAIVNNKEVQDEVCFVDESGQVYIKTHSTATINCNVSQNLKTGVPGNVIKTNGGVFIERDNGTVDQLSAVSQKLVRSNHQWVGKLIEQNRPYKLPIFINTHVFEAVVADFIDHEWAKPSFDLLHFTSELMEIAAEKYIEGIDSIKSIPLMASYLTSKSSEVVESLKVELREKVEEFIEREKKPYTQNHYLFENVSKLRSQRLKDEVTAAVEPYLGTGTTTVQVNPSQVRSIIDAVFERNQKRSVDDHMAEEMQHALNAYGKVALKRFIDNVPMLCIEIIQQFPSKLNNLLSDVTDDEISRIVVAPLDKVKTMDSLKRQIETLERGIATVRGFI